MMRYAMYVLMIGFALTGGHARPAAAQYAAASVDRGLVTTMPQGTQQAPAVANQPAPANIKLDLAITDTYGGTPSKKTVSMLIMAGQGGMIRTSNRLASGAEVKLNVDATARLHASAGFMTVQVTFEYTPAQTKSEESLGHPAMLHESLHVVLQNGKPLVVSQSADPSTERRVTVELTGTILK